MIKAFLSHSRQNGELVNAVAARVGRQFVTLDRMSFQAAEDLVECMERAVRESAIFVYFASREAANSSWVNYEIHQARFHQAMSRIRKVLVVILDDRITESDLPDWMQRSLFLRSRSPGPIARVIRDIVDELVQDQQHGHFVGRSTETESLQDALVPSDTVTGISLVAIRGLPGIGRRTLLARVAKDALSMTRTVAVRIESGDNINSVAMKLADLIEPIVTPDQSLETARAIQAFAPAEAMTRLMQDLSAAYALNEVVVFYDSGGLLTNDGTPTPPIGDILSAVAGRNDLFVAVVTNRRPSWRLHPMLDAVPIVDVQPLAERETRRLVTLLARSRGVTLSSTDVIAVADQVRGYPPSAMAMISLVQTYGPAVALRRQAHEAEYQPRPLTRYLRSLRLDSPERKLLRVLARNSPLPVDLLVSLVDGTDAALDALGNLIDLSVIVPQPGTSWYSISDPVVPFVEREIGPCTTQEYAYIADWLDRELQSSSEHRAYLDLSRVLYRAAVHAGQVQRSRAFAIQADWLRLAAELYHERDYERSLDLAQAANEASESTDSLSWVVKAEVKLGRYEDALAHVERLRRIGDVKEYYFLRGFIDRNRARYSEAVANYERAKEAGRGGLALERDLAECYFHLGNYRAASRHIEAAQGRQSDNPFVLSLRIKIACRLRDEATARRLLPLLDEVDDQSFAAHYHARVELIFGEVERAYEWAVRAVGSSARPPIETLSTLVICQIKTGRLEEARDRLTHLRRLYPSQRTDVQKGLAARLAIAEGNYEDALSYCASIEAEALPVHRALRRDALRGLLDHTSLSSDRRREVETEVAGIETELASVDAVTDWSIEPD